jgi:hypothetical protein
MFLLLTQDSKCEETVERIKRAGRAKLEAAMNTTITSYFGLLSSSSRNLGVAKSRKARSFNGTCR